MQCRVLEHLMKSIANSDENVIDWNVDYAFEYLLVTDSLRFSGLYCIFAEKLSSQERYRFYSAFSDAEESAVFSGQAEIFNTFKQLFSDNYLFIFRRAVKKHFLFTGILIGMLFICMNWILPGGIFINIAIIFFGYFCYRINELKKKISLTTEQNDIIIRELKGQELSEVAERLASELRKTGWLKT